jgi:Fibronectin-attachment protein (FAP)
VPKRRRITNDEGFSFVMPAGWVESDGTHLDYGSELLSKIVGEPAPGEAPPVANDTRIVMGRLDNRLYANAESDNTAAAKRLASDMGEFFMPYPGTRVGQKIFPVDGGAANYYTVKFNDSSKPDGQLMAAVVSRGGGRWFVLWLGTGNDPVDQTRTLGLANSIQA